MSLLTSCFTSHYVRLWPQVMGADRPMQASPMFDGRAVLYPSEAVLRDYLSWRQVDTHINNQVSALLLGMSSGDQLHASPTCCCCKET